MAQALDLDPLRRQLKKYYEDHGHLPDLNVVQNEWGFEIGREELCRERERIIRKTGFCQRNL